MRRAPVRPTSFPRTLCLRRTLRSRRRPEFSGRGDPSLGHLCTRLPWISSGTRRFGDESSDTLRGLPTSRHITLALFRSNFSPPVTVLSYLVGVCDLVSTTRGRTSLSRGPTPEGGRGLPTVWGGKRGVWDVESRPSHRTPPSGPRRRRWSIP